MLQNLNKNIKTLHNLHSVYINEPDIAGEMDIIFNWKAVVREQGKIDQYGYTTCNMYDNPNYQTYILHSILDHSFANDLMVIHHNNMATPISYSLNSGKAFELGRLLGTMRKMNNRRGTLTNEEGIYIVEYFRLTRCVGDNLEKTLDHINNVAHHITNDPEALMELKTLINQNLGNGKNNYNKYLTLRLVHFLPKEELVNNDAVYISNLNIVIAHSGTNRLILHPKSTAASRHIEGVSLPTLSSVTYEIVLNKLNPSDTDVYYVRNGNGSDPIRVTLDPDREEGVFKRTFINGIASDSVYCKLEEMGEKFGIYPTRELAETAGDISKQMEFDKLKNERLKIELDFKKIQSDNEKINVDLKKLEVDYHKLEVDNNKLEVEKNRLEVDKKKLETELKKISLENKKIDFERRKLQFEKEALKVKHIIERRGLEAKLKLAKLDVNKKKIEMCLLKYKSSIEVETLKYKLRHDLTMAKFALEKNREKIVSDAINGIQTTVSNAMLSVLGLIKFIK